MGKLGSHGPATRAGTGAGRVWRVRGVVMPIRDQLHIEKRGDYLLALDPLASNWVATDDDGGWALRQLRNGLSRDEVSYRFAKRAGVSAGLSHSR